MTGRRYVHGVLGVIGSVTVACRNSTPEVAACTPTVTPEVWVERRFPAPGRAASDTTLASVSLGIAQSVDSLGRIPPGSMISLLIAGPVAAERPDTVRLISAEAPNRVPLWRGDRVRAGVYVARLTTQGYEAGPRQFHVAPGERVEIDVNLHHTSGCAATTATR